MSQIKYIFCKKNCWVAWSNYWNSQCLKKPQKVSFETLHTIYDLCIQLPYKLNFLNKRSHFSYLVRLFGVIFKQCAKVTFWKKIVHGKFTAGCLLWHLALQIDWGGGCEKKISLTADLYHRLLSDPIWSIFVIREDSEKRGVLFAEWQITCCSFIGRFDSTGGFLTWFGPLGQKQILK